MTHFPGAPRETRARFNLGGGSGSGGSTVQATTTNNTPWNSSQLSDVFGNAKTQFGEGNGYSYFPNSTVVPFSNQTESALQSTEARAGQASPIISGAQSNLGQTLNGDFLSAGNPYLSGMVDNISNQIRPKIDAQFAGAGRYGSGAHANAEASAITDATTALGYQNYGDERNRQMQAQQLAPSTYGLGYAPDQMLAGVGAQRENMASSELQDQINRFNFNQSSPDEALRRYASLVAGGNYGGQQVSQAPLYRNQASSALGGALGGAALGNMTGLGSGLGAAGGALLGLL